MPMRLPALLALLILTAAGQAADVPRPADGFADPYDIEIVIFERFAQGDTEHWPEEPGEPDLGLAIGDLSDPELSGERAVVVPQQEQQLGPAAYTLQRKGAVVHAHQRWRQDVGGRASDTWYRVADQTLDGLIRVSKGRYLHLDTDLLLRAADTQQTWRIQLHRRMRSGELHYVDHPKLGILIRADRYEPEAPLEAELPQQELEVPTPETAPEPEQPEAPAGDLPRAMPDPT